VTETAYIPKASGDDLSFYKMLIDNTYDWEYMLSPHMELLYISPSCERITGYTPVEFYNDSNLLINIIHREDRRSFKEHFERRVIKKSDCKEFLEFRIVTKWGKIEWIGHECQNVFDDENVHRGVRGSNRLITNYKILQEQHKELSNVHKSIVSQTPLGIISYDKDGNCLFANAAVAGIVGATRQQLLKQNYHNIQSWKDSGLYPHILKATETNETQKAEIALYSTFGKQTYLKCTIVPLQNMSKARIMILVEDIGLRKRAEDRLKESEEKFRAISTQIQDGIAIFNEEGEFSYVNPAFCEITGYSEGELLQQNFFDLQDTGAQPLIDIKEFNASGYPYLRNLDLFRRDGSKYIAGYSVKPISIGNERYFLSSLRDITEIAKYEEELKNANMAKDKFISIISHDLRSPFNTLIGLSEMMPMFIEMEEYDKLAEMAHHLKDASSNTFQLLDNLLQWAKTQGGSIECNPDLYDLEEIVTSASASLIENSRQKDISIHNDIAKHTMVYADSNMVETAVRNLLSNSIKFTPDGGSIEISAKAIDGKVEFIIKDSGVGMSPDQIEKLFKLEHTHSLKGTRGEKGSGLGLLICKEFIEKNSGLIKVSSSPGKGSEFLITLPGEAAAAVNNGASTAVVDNGSGI
jgi:PAS domain S-box-containing protein